MDELSDPRAEQVARLEERVRSLAREKAHLQLVNYMMGRMGGALGVEGTLEALLRGVLEHLGGSNVVVYYREEGVFRSADVFGGRAELDGLADPLVRKVFESGQPVEVHEDFEATGLTTAPTGDASTWVYPLAVGGEVLGVLEMEGLQAPTLEFRPILPAFFSYAALLLKHKLEAAARLRRAYEQVALTEALRRSQEQLRQAQKMEALGLLAGGVAHDLNNILQVIVAFSTLLRESLGDPSDLECVDEVLAGAKRATDLTRGLLAFSRRQPLELKALDLNGLVTTTRKFLDRLIGEDVVLATRLAPEELVVSADATLLQQVLVNLVTNARDAMPGGGRLTIATEALPAGPRPPPGEGDAVSGDPVTGPAVRLTVTDTGAGIAPADLPRVLEPFFTTKDKGKGTGLGLSVVYGIVKQHAGQLRVASALGQGTQVEVTLPRLGERPAEEALRPGRGPGSRHESVLVVEDDASVRNAVRAVLQGSGYRVEVAGDGQEAIDRFQGGARFDLVLLDLVMPRRNGREALEAIRALVPGQRALFMSGYAADVLDTRGLAELDVPIVMKPFTPPALLLALRGALDRPGRAGGG